MRKTELLAFILISAMLCVCSCGQLGTKGQIRKTLLRFEAEKIVVPESLIEIKDGNIRRWSAREDSLLRFILYFPPYECTECALAHLVEHKPLFRIAEESGSFSPMIIFSPDPESVQELIGKVANARYPFPVYIDPDQVMHNNKIPHDRLYHFFLIGRSGKPVFVGNPLGNEKTAKLFSDIILQNHSK